MIVALWVVLVSSVVLAGFFSLNAYALRNFRRVRLEEAFGGRAIGRKRLEQFDRHVQAVRLTVALLRALATIALAVCVLNLLAGQGSGLGRAILATLVAGTILAIFGVAVPHAWADYAGERIIAASFPLLLALRYLLYPVVAVMQAIDAPIRRLSGADGPPAEPGEEAKQEILQAASEGRAEGAVDADEMRMLTSVMKFGRRQAREIMTPRTDIFALPTNLPVQDLVRQVVEASHTRVPVYEGDLDNIVGILYVKDLLAHVDGIESVVLVKIVRKPFFVPETKPLEDLLREFKSRKLHIAVVLDEYGGTAGLITMEDVLEEIVGDIADEYDQPPAVLLKRLDERTAEVDGRMRIDEINEALGLRISEQENYDTVAGLVFSELGYIPSVGEKVERNGASFTVLAADERKITRLRVELTDTADSAEEE